MSASATGKAAGLLQFYMARAWEAAGLKWHGDNDAETGDVVDLIIKAAREELPALDRQCWSCKGAGSTGGWPVTRPCGECGAAGYIITGAGREVIAFLQRHPAALTRVS